ncbi:MAG: four helix bundle protein [Candidatus Sumerlaeales bacterium]|nr:four helix bundle protein [Candidatus Sumerlaeales bacterium]
MNHIGENETGTVKVKSRKYWLDLLRETDYIEQQAYDSIKHDCEEIRQMLSFSTKTFNSIFQTPLSKLTKGGEAE